MVGFSSQTESWVATRNSIYESQKEADSFELDLKRLDLIKIDQEDENNNINSQDKISTTKKNKKKNQVLLEGYVEAVDEEDELKRTKSLTGDDLDELKGCLDLGFGFSYEEIPELCNTLPALELCYSMSQKYLDDHQHHASPDTTATPEPVANWKISSPGDHPEDVKARLKFWAQAVACTQLWEIDQAKILKMDQLQGAWEEAGKEDVTGLRLTDDPMSLDLILRRLG
ncbi:hypothetical protein Gorai_023753, partial [Gossypium raimondii]|nr:hypothetical protein [Gossypium raimondii]